MLYSTPANDKVVDPDANGFLLKVIVLPTTLVTVVPVTSVPVPPVAVTIIPTRIPVALVTLT